MRVWKMITMNPRRFLIVVVAFAFCLRLSIIFAAATYRVVEDDTNHFGFGWEMGRVASSIADGRGFSSPLPSLDRTNGHCWTCISVDPFPDF